MTYNLIVENLTLNVKRRGLHPGNFESYAHGDDRVVVPRREIKDKKFRCGEGQHIMLTEDGVKILYFKNPERR